LNIPYKLSKKVYFVTLIISLIWCSLIVLTPVLAGMQGFPESVSTILYLFFSNVCHQIDDRSYHIMGHALGVCSRCSFIYFAFLLGVILYPFIHKLNNVRMPAIWVIITAVVLMLVDSVLDIFDVFNNTFLTRSVTGFFLGFVLPFYLIPGFTIFSYEIHSYFKYKNQTSDIK
jgi:uncharacterized membrane protein